MSFWDLDTELRRVYDVGMNSERIGAAVVTLGIIAVLLSVVVSAVQWNDCRNDGGTFVQGVAWYHCVDKDD